MRFKPTTPFGIPHSSSEDGKFTFTGETNIDLMFSCIVVANDFLIPKGATLITSMHSIHITPEVYAEPLRFYPERFLNNLKTMDANAKGKLEGRDHFNFGWGKYAIIICMTNIKRERTV